jgi:hypothetical protein
MLQFILALGLLGTTPIRADDDEAKIPPDILQVGGSIPVRAPETTLAGPKTDPAEAEALSRILRDLVHKSLPDPLSKSSQNWGNQKAVTVVKRQREGLRIWSEPVQEMKNHGVWRKTAIRIPDHDKLALSVTQLTHPQDGKIHATVAVVANRVDLLFEQQIWRSGLRIYAGETRAHCKGAILLKAEVTTKTEFAPGSFLPQVSLKVQVTNAELFYENLVVDHTAGLDGEAAKKLGSLTLQVVKAVKPNIEKDLLAKANAAIVKAGGTHEFKVALDKIISTKK